MAPGLTLLTWCLLGLCIGSFVNVVVARLPVMMERRWWGDIARHLQEETPPVVDAAGCTACGQQLAAGLEAAPELNLARPRSHCPSCGHRLAWHELLPIVSWLWLRGRCSACRAPIGARLPVVEAGCGLLFVLLGWRMGFEARTLLWCGWAATLVALALIDWDTLLLPDDLTQPLLWAGLIASAVGWTLPPAHAVAGAVAGYGALWAVAWVFERLRGQAGMGAGDFKLLAALGAWLGPTALLPVVMVASVGGVAVGLWMKARGTLREGVYVPFGPFLAAAGLIWVLIGGTQMGGWP